MTSQLQPVPGGIAGIPVLPRADLRAHGFHMLTNDLGEPTGNVHPEDLERYGLPWGSWGGAFHPLTDGEAACIAEGVVDTGAGTFVLGYTSLYQGRKWLIAIREQFSNLSEATGDFGRDTVLRAWRHTIEGLGGLLLVVTDGGPGHQVDLMVLFPLARIQRWGGHPDVAIALIAAIFGEDPAHFAFGGPAARVLHGASGGPSLDPGRVHRSLHRACTDMLTAFVAAHFGAEGTALPEDDPRITRAVAVLSDARSPLLDLVPL